MAKTQWFGYGEDALTYWALQTRLACILDQLNDKSSEGEGSGSFLAEAYAMYKDVPEQDIIATLEI